MNGQSRSAVSFPKHSTSSIKTRPDPRPKKALGNATAPAGEGRCEGGREGGERGKERGKLFECKLKFFLTFSIAESQLPAHHCSIEGVPLILTHSAKLHVQADLHSSLRRKPTVHQPQLSIHTHLVCRARDSQSTMNNNNNNNNNTTTTTTF